MRILKWAVVVALCMLAVLPAFAIGLRRVSSGAMISPENLPLWEQGTRVVRGSFQLTQDGLASDDGYLLYALDVPSDYTFQVRLRMDNTGPHSYHVGIAFRWQDESNHYYLEIDEGNDIFILGKCERGEMKAFGMIPSPFGFGEWYDLRIEVTGSLLRAYLNNELELEAQDETFPTGKLAIYNDYKAVFAQPLLCGNTLTIEGVRAGSEVVLLNPDGELEAKGKAGSADATSVEMPLAWVPYPFTGTLRMIPPSAEAIDAPIEGMVGGDVWEVAR